MSILYKLGADEAAQQLGLTAELFAEHAKKDETRANEKGKVAPNPTDNKKPNWSGASSLEGGDTGTRNEQMGLPRFSGV